ncbi:MAG: phosphoribosyl-ATP diphosphatase [Alphaproteobacteria bacterium]|nr:MAG: phosphoribosyl-ATP diphosphatase [Alphaproteobacteria bacterium]
MTDTANTTLGAALDALLATIDARAAQGDAGASYTAKLLGKGTAKCAEKLGEEAVETVIAAVRGERSELAHEAADLLYHLGVLLKSAGVAPQDVAKALENRRGQSGLAEKASRAPK